jgi:hypothetical protein
LGWISDVVGRVVRKGNKEVIYVMWILYCHCLVNIMLVRELVTGNVLGFIWGDALGMRWGCVGDTCLEGYTYVTNIR